MKFISKKAVAVVTTFILGMSFSAHAERARLLVQDMEALQARVSLIENAKQEIFAEYFSVWNDDQSVGGFALLLKAAQEGKKVKVIIDALSNTVPNSLFAALLNQGKDAAGNQNLEIKVYNPFKFKDFMKATHRDHAKMLIVDGEDLSRGRLITGGRNIGDKYFGLSKKRNFKDVDVLTEGQAAQSAREKFMAVWNSDLTVVPGIGRYENVNFDKPCGGDSFHRDICERRQERAELVYKKEVQRIQSSLHQLINHSPQIHVNLDSKRDWLENVENYENVQFLSHSPEKLVSKTTNRMADQLMKLALTAEKEVNILSPYLIPTEGMIKIFQRLLDRNVKIRIITNSLNSTDNLPAQAGYKGSKEQMIKMGIELYEFKGPDTAHAKVAVIDNKISIVGTYNLDPRSTALNREVGLAVRGDENNPLATDLTSAIEGFRSNSLLVGKDGVAQNRSEWDKGVSKKKMTTLKLLMVLLPHYRSQI